MRRSLRRHPGESGLTLVEVLVSMGLLAVALTGVAGMQILASGANASARNMATAARLAADVGEVLQLWEYDDPRLQPSLVVSGETVSPFIVEEQLEEMTRPLDFALGDYDGAAVRNVRGLDRRLPGPEVDDKFRIYWWVGEEDTNLDAVPDAKLITVVVRWYEAGRWRNVNFTQARFNPAVLRP